MTSGENPDGAADRGSGPAPAPPADGNHGGTVSLLEQTPGELVRRFAEWGEPKYRADQLRRWIFERFAGDFDEMTNLPKSLRERLATETRLNGLEPAADTESEDGLTRKYLFRLADGQTVETVLMLYADAPHSPELEEGEDRSARYKRRTVCISTQVGCPVGCPFCATGQAGFVRNLTPGEILAQVHRVGGAILRDPDLRPTGAGAHPVTNIVFMGMGEPLLRFDITWAAVEGLIDRRRFALGARRLTISTAGIIPGIDRLRETGVQVNLAVSLHAPDDELRDQLVPINRKYPVARLMKACAAYIEATGRRITFEYALIDHVNDHERQARGMVRRLRGMLAHVNLIPLNPIPASPFRRPSPDRVSRFAAILHDAGIPTTMRVEKGIRIAAGCGQLRQAKGNRGQT